MNLEQHNKEKNKRSPRIIRGDDFDLTFWGCFYHYQKPFVNYWHKKRFSLKSVSEITYRAINHWTSLGLLDDDREDKQKWRRIGLLDAIWIQIIKELREFGLSSDKIRHAKNCLISLEYNDEYFPIFEYYLTLILYNKLSIYLIVFSDGFADIATRQELEIAKNRDKFQQSYVVIQLTSILQDMYKQVDLEPKFDSCILATDDIMNVLAAMQNNNCRKIEIKLKDGKIQKIDLTKKVTEDFEKIIDIIKSKEFQTIKIDIEDHKPVYIEQQERKKV